jgi:hypothetical protein
MEKIKLTKEQADFARKFAAGFGDRFPDLPLDNFCYALLHGYEVETEEIDPGDYVISRTGMIGRVDSLHTDGWYRGVWFTRNGSEVAMQCTALDISRHATLDEVDRAKQFEARIADRKLDKLLLRLTSSERVRLLEKLGGDE